MLKLRVISALVMAAVFLCALLFLPWVGFTVFTGVVFAVGAWEWAKLSGFNSLFAKAGYVVIVIVSAVLLAYFSAWTSDISLFKPMLLVACTWWALALLWVQTYPASAILWRPRFIRALIGGLVIIPAWLSAIYLHKLNHGVMFICIVVLAVACADIGAYFFGRAFGKRKLMINVSPGKSWEGALGGVLVASCFAAIIAFTCDVPHFYTPFILIVPIAFVSVLGDLLESMFKRHRGVKDSGCILPGHGGVLDRVDGLVAAIPLFTLLLIESKWGG